MKQIRALRGIVAAALLAAALGACSPDEPPSDPERNAAAAPTGRELGQRLVDAMGGRAALERVQSLVLRGSGTRTRMGQIAETGGEDPTGTLTSVTETIDLANGRAGFDYDVTVGDFTQHRTEVFTTHNGMRVGWNTGPGRPVIVTSPDGIFSWATQNTPEMLLRRNVLTVALAAASGGTDEPAERRTFAGRESLYATARLPSGEEIGLHFDPQTSLLLGFTALDTETMLGDVEAEYALDDWRTVRDVLLPHSVTITKQGRPYSSIEYDSIAINNTAALALLEIPDEAVEQAEEVVAAGGSWSPLAWNEVAPGVYHAVGYSHHSMVVEFPSFVVVVEAPYTDAQSATLARLVEENLGKPIRYVVPSHPHYDHTGGLRGIVATGATAVLAAGHEAELRAVIEAPHTNPPDALARRRAAGEGFGAIEVLAGSRTIEEGDRALELYEVETIPHVRPKVLAYVPHARAVFQSDLFFGGPSPDAEALYEALRERERELEVELIVGGHGGVLPFAALEEAVGGE